MESQGVTTRTGSLKSYQLMSGKRGDALRYRAFVTAAQPYCGGPATTAAVWNQWGERVLAAHTLREAAALGEAYVSGIRFGERKGKAEIAEWVLGSDTLDEARKVGGWGLL